MPADTDVVVCAPFRSPVGRFGGVFKTVPVADLGSAVLAGLFARTGLDPAAVDEVLLGHCYPSSDAPAIGRVVALDAGCPVETTGLQIDRRCGSGLQAVVDAFSRVQSGAADVVVAGGVESMSRAAFYSHAIRFGVPGQAAVFDDTLAVGRVTAGGKRFPVPGGMIETAENLRAQYDISRTAQDELAVLSHSRAVAAQDSGVFAEEIVPVTVRGRKGDTVVDTDEHPRRGLDLETLAGLKPIYATTTEGATVTAGNASGQNDGAAMCVVTTRAKAADLGLTPLATLRGWSVAGVPASHMGIGPVPAVAKLFARTGLGWDDLDLVELNEAFAAQALACTTEWGFGDLDGPLWSRTNVHGSGISLGHPVGATGVRILTTMLRELDRRDGRFALETMCIGGGQGLAAIFERA